MLTGSVFGSSVRAIPAACEGVRPSKDLSDGLPPPFLPPVRKPILHRPEPPRVPQLPSTPRLPPLQPLPTAPPIPQPMVKGGEAM
jgi:hypothetical protein